MLLTTEADHIRLLEIGELHVSARSHSADLHPCSAKRANIWEEKVGRQGGTYLAESKHAGLLKPLQSLQFIFPALVRWEAGRGTGEGAEELNGNGQRTGERELRKEMEKTHFHSFSGSDPEAVANPTPQPAGRWLQKDIAPVLAAVAKTEKGTAKPESCISFVASVTQTTD